MPYPKRGPDAPTRLAEHTQMETRLQAIYFIRDSGIFIVIDRHAEPTFHNAVVVDQLDEGALVIEPYEGQSYLGVVRVLEQWAPSIYVLTLQLLTGLLVV